MMKHNSTTALHRERAGCRAGGDWRLACLLFFVLRVSLQRTIVLVALTPERAVCGSLAHTSLVRTQEPVVRALVIISLTPRSAVSFPMNGFSLWVIVSR